MRRIWASIAAVWSTLALVGVLAWSQPAPRPAAQSAPLVVVQRSGSKQFAHAVLLPSSAQPLTSTGSSHVAP